MVALLIHMTDHIQIWGFFSEKANNMTFGEFYLFPHPKQTIYLDVFEGLLNYDGQHFCQRIGWSVEYRNDQGK